MIIEVFCSSVEELSEYTRLFLNIQNPTAMRSVVHLKAAENLTQGSFWVILSNRFGHCVVVLRMLGSYLAHKGQAGGF